MIILIFLRKPLSLLRPGWSWMLTTGDDSTQCWDKKKTLTKSEVNVTGQLTISSLIQRHTWTHTLKFLKMSTSTLRNIITYKLHRWSAASLPCQLHVFGLKGWKASKRTGWSKTLTLLKTKRWLHLNLKISFKAVLSDDSPEQLTLTGQHTFRTLTHFWLTWGQAAN